MDERVDLAQFFFRHVLRRIEILYAPAEARRETADVEFRDRAYAAPTFDDVFPRRFDFVANRGNDSHAGNDDSSTLHVSLSEAGQPEMNDLLSARRAQAEPERALM